MPHLEDTLKRLIANFPEKEWVKVGVNLRLWNGELQMSQSIAFRGYGKEIEDEAETHLEHCLVNEPTNLIIRKLIHEVQFLRAQQALMIEAMTLRPDQPDNNVRNPNEPKSPA